jgi:hypothetical protein
VAHSDDALELGGVFGDGELYFVAMIANDAEQLAAVLNFVVGLIDVGLLNERYVACTDYARGSIEPPYLVSSLAAA